MNTKDRDHARFVKHLNESKYGVWLVADWLNDKHKFDVTITSNTVSKGYEDRMDHVDRGDLYISKPSIEPMRVEVKSLSAEFTCKEEWPFGGEMIVCAKHSYDNAEPKPYMYVLLNNQKTHAIIIKGEDHDKWRVKVYPDKRYENMVQSFYITSVEDVKFIEL